MRSICALVAACLMAGSAFAQSEGFQFEATIKLRGGGGVPIPAPGDLFYPGGVFQDGGVTLRLLIDIVYDIDDLGLKIVGLPDWAEDAVYSIYLKAGAGYPSAVSENQNKENIKAMIRAMLADRFQLQMHQEDRETEVWVLQMKGDRPKLQSIAAPVPPEESRSSVFAGDLRGSIRGSKAPMADLARSLTMALKQRVLDRTGMTGFYDFDETWGTPYQRGEPASANALSAEGMAQLFSVLDQSLGLTLKREKVLADYWVVDRVEKPGEN